MPYCGGKSVIFADPKQPLAEKERLIRALRALGTYAPGADDLWLEVSLTEGRTFVDGSE